MNNVSFGNGEQKQNMGSSLASSLISTGVTAGAGALAGAGVAKVVSLAPVTTPTTEKILEELMANGDTFVKGNVETIANINKASLCDTLISEMDDVVEALTKNGSKKGLFKKVSPEDAVQEYLRSIMDAIGEKVEDGVQLTKEQVKETVKNKRASITGEPSEKLVEIIGNARKGLLEKAEEFLRTHKKGDELFDNALKATKKMKDDIRMSNFVKWGAIIALGLSVIGNFIPRKAQKETAEA